MIKSNATKNIVIIDDDICIINSLKFILKNTNNNITYFNNSKEAFNNILNNNYDIIITDIEMPSLSGIEMIKELQKIKKLNKIIFMSSNIEEYKSSILKLKAFYLDKPISKDKILNLITAQTKSEKGVVFMASYN